MAELDIDFEGNGGSTQVQSVDNGDEKQDLNGGGDEDITGKSNANQGGDGDGTGNGDGEGNGDDNGGSSTGELNEGDTIEFEGATYTVDASGNLVDDKGAIFKEADKVADWLKEMEVDNGDGEGNFDINAIQEAIGITVTDENGQNIEFTNDAAGVKAYVDSVLDLKSAELQEATINKFFTDNPMVKGFIDYVQLNGTPRGFGEIPDRSGVVVDKDNVAQQEAIVRMAAAEFGNKSFNENYIKYLRDSGGLYDEAKNQLAALQEKDANYRKEIETRAQQQREQEAQDVANYWNNVSKVIDSRVIAGYKLPETLIKEVNGQKVTLTPNDFYDYLSKARETDTEGNKVTGYQRDLSKLTDEEYLNRELLDAWLMFTGGSYADLVNMAVKEEQVRQLRVKAKETKTNKSVRIVKKQTKGSIEDIVLS